MLAIAIALLFGLAGSAAIAVLRAALIVGLGRSRLILAELSEIERRAGAARPASYRPELVLRPAFAAA